MEKIKSIAYRCLTNADFFNINKPPLMESKGGGQAYIDFPVSAISLAEWDDFFDGVYDLNTEQGTQGPAWIFPIYSISLDDIRSTPSQYLKIYQRRKASVSITSQKLVSRKSNRVKAWHPDAGFPYPVDNTDRTQCPEGLMVYLAKTEAGKIWAGWFLNDGTTLLPIKGLPPDSLNLMFSQQNEKNGYSGIINFQANDSLYLDPSNKKFPLQAQGDNTFTSNIINPANNESQFIDDLFDSDTNNNPVLTKEYIISIKQRNKSIVKKLKSLYNHTCQITGKEFSFQKKDGIDYTEVHHLIALGDGGSDDIRNLIVVNPLIHKMLHYAKVEGLDLSKIVINESGYAHLDIYINDKKYTITWHPKHAELI